jgi:peptide chain release factor
MGRLGMDGRKVHKGMSIRESDIIEKFIRSAGPGGQNVNKVSTCVYLKHIPTGIEVKCQQERSQAANRWLARQILFKKIKSLISGKALEEKRRIEKIKRQNRKRSKMAKIRVLETKRKQSEKKKFRKSVRLTGLEVVVIFILLFSSFLPCVVRTSSLASDDNRQKKVAEGLIVDVDWVGQTIVVRWLQTQGDVQYDEISIFVPDNTRITKGSDTISLSDINITDPVTVEYYNAAPGPLTAVSINVKL